MNVTEQYTSVSHLGKGKYPTVVPVAMLSHLKRGYRKQNGIKLRSTVKKTAQGHRLTRRRRLVTGL